jgi:hypothetical protein
VAVPSERRASPRSPLSRSLIVTWHPTLPCRLSTSGPRLRALYPGALCGPQRDDDGSAQPTCENTPTRQGQENRAWGAAYLSSRPTLLSRARSADCRRSTQRTTWQNGVMQLGGSYLPGTSAGASAPCGAVRERYSPRDPGGRGA